MSRLSGIYHEKVADLGAIADGDEAAVSETVPGAQLGDFVFVSASINQLDLSITGYVSAADTVKILVYNNVGSSIDLGSCNFAIKVVPRDAI